MQGDKKLKARNGKSLIQILTVLSTFVILTTAGVYIYSNKEDGGKTNNQRDKKEFIFETARGETFHIKAFKNHLVIKELIGKILFLKVFGWNCEYCQKEIPELKKLKRKFSDAFDTIAIEYQHHTKDENLKLIEKYGINYHIVEGDKNLSFLNYLKNQYNWNGVIPLTIVIGTDGQILAFEVGYKSYSLTTLLQTTLKEITTEAKPQKEEK
jgi:thiol-disulfide isomerase/thioredoxin